MMKLLPAFAGRRLRLRQRSVKGGKAHMRATDVQ
jgi:hypothetical protein